MYNCMNRVIHINFEGKTEIVGGSEFAVYVVLLITGILVAMVDEH